MTDTLSFVIAGFFLGLNGLIPGPIFTLIVSETLKHNAKEGIKVAFAPLVTDFPIVLVSILLLSRLADQDIIMGVISFAGSAFLIYLAFESLSFKGTEPGASAPEPESLKKGIITNLLNPSPYMFWFSIGAPTFVRAMDKGITTALLFILSFYIVLVGSLSGLALTAGRSKRFLAGRYYIYLIRFIGIVLLCFAFLFIRNGIRLLAGI
jgi:threonine/homoserine/homoserine lactone efflux protein